MSSDSTSPSACPVDHKSREAWLKAAQKPQQPSQPPPQQQPPATALPTSCDSTTMSTTTPPPHFPTHGLSTHRQISSIPRAHPSTTSSSSSSSSSSANAQTPPQDTHTSPSGHWIYPSESQFLSAILRKRSSPNSTTPTSRNATTTSTTSPTSTSTTDPSTIPTLIPIHNAVNERTWHLILQWEAPYTSPSSACPLGPKLLSFSGDSAKLSPRAAWNKLLGYARPFDRHDWVVERCGVRVEYVIDFYAGKPAAAGSGKRGRGRG